MLCLCSEAEFAVSYSETYVWSIRPRVRSCHCLDVLGTKIYCRPIMWAMQFQINRTNPVLILFRSTFKVQCSVSIFTLFFLHSCIQWVPRFVLRETDISCPEKLVARIKLTYFSFVRLFFKYGNLLFTMDEQCVILFWIYCVSFMYDRSRLSIMKERGYLLTVEQKKCELCRWRVETIIDFLYLNISLFIWLLFSSDHYFSVGFLRLKRSYMTT